MKLCKALFQRALQGIFLFQLLLSKFVLTLAWQWGWQAALSHPSCSSHSQAGGIRHLPVLDWGMSARCLRARVPLALGAAPSSGRCRGRDVAVGERSQLTHIEQRWGPRQPAACSASSTVCPETLLLGEGSLCRTCLIFAVSAPSYRLRS